MGIHFKIELGGSRPHASNHHDTRNDPLLRTGRSNAHNLRSTEVATGGSNSEWLDKHQKEDRNLNPHDRGAGRNAALDASRTARLDTKESFATGLGIVPTQQNQNAAQQQLADLFRNPAIARAYLINPDRTAEELGKKFPELKTELERNKPFTVKDGNIEVNQQSTLFRAIQSEIANGIKPRHSSIRGEMDKLLSSALPASLGGSSGLETKAYELLRERAEHLGRLTEKRERIELKIAKLMDSPQAIQDLNEVRAARGVEVAAKVPLQPAQVATSTHTVSPTPAQSPVSTPASTQPQPTVQLKQEARLDAKAAPDPSAKQPSGPETKAATEKAPDAALKEIEAKLANAAKKMNEQDIIIRRLELAGKVNSLLSQADQRAATPKELQQAIAKVNQDSGLKPDGIPVDTEVASEILRVRKEAKVSKENEVAAHCDKLFKPLPDEANVEQFRRNARHILALQKELNGDERSIFNEKFKAAFKSDLSAADYLHLRTAKKVAAELYGMVGPGSDDEYGIRATMRKVQPEELPFLKKDYRISAIRANLSSYELEEFNARLDGKPVLAEAQAIRGHFDPGFFGQRDSARSEVGRQRVIEALESLTPQQRAELTKVYSSTFNGADLRKDVDDNLAISTGRTSPRGNLSYVTKAWQLLDEGSSSPAQIVSK